jgi:hypothetical protein
MAALFHHINAAGACTDSISSWTVVEENHVEQKPLLLSVLPQPVLISVLFSTRVTLTQPPTPHVNAAMCKEYINIIPQCLSIQMR